MFLGFLYPVVEPGEVLCKKSMSTRKKLQADVLVLCTMYFQLSNTVVALHLDHITTKAYFCDQVAQHLFFILD